MTSQYLDNATAWSFSLRTLMGYPEHAPPFHTTKWCNSGPLDLDQVMTITRLATDMRSDFVHVAFELGTDEPVAISLFVRREHGIEWMPNVLPFAASETAKIELLADKQRWFVGQRQALTAGKLPPTGKWERGVAIARRRWRKAAANTGSLELAGSLWVPPGGGYADAIPQDELNIAA
ncbi:hypothetical protein SPAN111604_11945 [Sphingomonas antarctica]|uniref:hypothetical protein n=1 Tax=Sphingomonas antarctica TaxID=2040274 RepID=UPI0039E86491